MSDDFVHPRAKYGALVDGTGAIKVNDLALGDYVPPYGVVAAVEPGMRAVSWRDGTKTSYTREVWTNANFEGVRRFVIEEEPVP